MRRSLWAAALYLLLLLTACGAHSSQEEISRALGRMHLEFDLVRVHRFLPFLAMCLIFLGADILWRRVVRQAERPFRQRAAACLGTEPGETLVVEDALFALQTAKAAGFLTAGVAERYSAPEQEEIRSLADLYGQDPADLLKKLRETEREERRG